jgi:hypothetical protein
MHGKLERDATRVTDAVAHALGQLEVVAIARPQIRAGLSMPMMGLPVLSSSRVRP